MLEWHSRDCDWVTGWMVQGSNRGKERTFFLENFHNGWRIPSRLLFCGYWVYFPARKRPPCSADLNNKCSYTSALPTCLNGVNMDNFAFHFSRTDSIWIRLALSLKPRSFLSCGHQLSFPYVTLPAKLSSNKYVTKDIMCCLFVGSCTKKILGSWTA